jgi:hypothetical protein
VALVEKAEQTARISQSQFLCFKPSCITLIHAGSWDLAIASCKTFVSQALTTERVRLTAILEHRLDRATLDALDALYVDRDGLYAITPLKRDPKDFSAREMKREIARCQSLEALYRTARTLLPELDIANDSVAYYAALVDYYTVQKLQQLRTLPGRRGRLHHRSCPEHERRPLPGLKRV